MNIGAALLKLNTIRHTFDKVDCDGSGEVDREGASGAVDSSVRGSSHRDRSATAAADDHDALMLIDWWTDWGCPLIEGVTELRDALDYLGVSIPSAQFEMLWVQVDVDGLPLSSFSLPYSLPRSATCLLIAGLLPPSAHCRQPVCQSV